MAQAPCKNCLDRELGCHSTCEKYIQFQVDNKAETEARRSIMNEHNQHVSFLAEQKRKRMRSHR